VIEEGARYRPLTKGALSFAERAHMVDRKEGRGHLSYRCREGSVSRGRGEREKPRLGIEYVPYLPGRVEEHRHSIDARAGWQGKFPPQRGGTVVLAKKGKGTSKSAYLEGKKEGSSRPASPQGKGD